MPEAAASRKRQMASGVKEWPDPGRRGGSQGVPVPCRANRIQLRLTPPVIRFMPENRGLMGCLSRAVEPGIAARRALIDAP
jgi:hypothetical protein